MKGISPDTARYWLIFFKMSNYCATVNISANKSDVHI